MAVEAAKIVINVSAEGTDKAATGLGKVDEKVGGISETIKQLVAGGAIIAVTKAFLDFASTTGKAFGIAETAAVRLEKVAEMKGLDGAATRFTKLAGAMQTLTGVSDEVVKNIASELLAQGKSEAMTQKMIKAAADLSAVTGDSLNTSVEKLNRSLSGQAGMLARTNPELNKLTKAQLEAGGAIDLIADKYSGMAESMRGTLEVSERVREQTVGDLVETFGQFLAPAIQVVNEAFTSMATIGIEIMNFINQMPAPIRLAIVAFTALAGVITALAIAQATGLALKAKEVIASTISIAKTVAETVAKWALQASTMAVQIATAVGIPTQWAAIAAAVAMTAAVTATAVGMSNMATQTDISTRSTYNQAESWRTAKHALIDYDNVRKKSAEVVAQREREAAAANQSEYNRTVEYNKLQSDTIALRSRLSGLEKIGSITREESLERQIQAEKKAYEATIERSLSVKDPKPLLQSAKNHQEMIKKLEDDLKRLDKSRETSENKYRENFAKTMEFFNNRQEEHEEERQSQLAETMQMLNSHFDEYGDVIEDNHSAWIESIEETKAAYENMFSIVTNGLSSVAKIADNIANGRMMRIEEEEEKRKEAEQRQIEDLIASGATEDQIAATKEQIDKRQMERDKAIDRQKKIHEREAAIRAKGMAIFQAMLNLPIMVMQGIMLPPPLGGPIGGALYGALGAMQLAEAASTPIPSAQFGGEFMVPPGYHGDSGLVRVNSGEKISVEPVRSSGNDNKTMVVQIGQRDFEGYLQEVLNSGRVTIRRQGVVRYA
jgi:hypothetical protein